MCRRQFDEQFMPVVDKETQKEIEELFPQDFEERKKQLIMTGLWRGEKVAIKFTFGNLHSIIEKPKSSISDPK